MKIDPLVHNILCIIQIGVAVAFIALLIWAGYKDSKTRLIKNKTCLAIAVLGIVNIAINGLWPVGLYAITGALIVLIILLVPALLPTKGKMGGGDLKLPLASSLLLGPFGSAWSLLIAFALYLTGICVRKISTHKSMKSSMPFGPLYAVAGIGVYLYSIYLHLS